MRYSGSFKAVRHHRGNPSRLLDHEGDPILMEASVEVTAAMGAVAVSGVALEGEVEAIVDEEVMDDGSDISELSDLHTFLLYRDSGFESIQRGVGGLAC